MISRRQVAGGLLGLLSAAVSASAQRRRRVVVTRRAVVVHPRYPVARVAARTVVIRPARRTVVVGAPLVFLPVVAFAAVVATLPPRERLIWQDTEAIDRDEEWVESNFGIDQRGDALFLEIDGRAQLDALDVTFENGEVQVVDFHEKVHGSGIYKLYDFPGRRNVKTVRLIARSKSEKTTFRMFLGV